MEVPKKNTYAIEQNKQTNQPKTQPTFKAATA